MIKKRIITNIITWKVIKKNYNKPMAQKMIMKIWKYKKCSKNDKIKWIVIKRITKSDYIKM